jgi:predicted transporter
MELKSLFLGLTFTIGVFAIKTGVGMHYIFAQRRSVKGRIFFICGFAFTYLCMFFVSYLILRKINISDYYTAFQGFFRSGMYIHFFMAAGLIVWGIYLLKKEGRVQGGSKAFWAMIIPCPVCTSVVFLTTAFLVAYFPNSALPAVIYGYLFFIAITFFTMLILTFWEMKAEATPEHTLAAAMLLIAVYFIVSIIIMPQFTDIDTIYRIASYRGEKGSLNRHDILVLSAAVLALFLTGYLIMKRKMRREQNWI